MAELNFGKSLNNDVERSARCFAVYRKYARRPESKESWTRSLLCPKVEAELKPLRDTGEVGLNALGIGSGSGEVEYWMLSELRQSSPNITHLSVEPSAEELVKYRHLIDANNSDLTGVKFDLRQMTFKEYRDSRDKTRENQKFHLITAFHSLYYEPDLEAVLEYLYGCLTDSGVLVVALDSDDDGFGRLRCQLPLAWDTSYHYCSANHVKSYFDKLYIPYATLRRPSQVDVAPCLSHHCSSSGEHLQSPESGDGAMLLDFIFQVADFHRTVSAEKQQELLEYLRSICTENNGEMLVQCDTEYVVVKKLCVDE